ncbi:MAG: acyl-CoA dehydrogenase family protein [Roseicyclus sp.]
MDPDDLRMLGEAAARYAARVHDPAALRARRGIGPGHAPEQLQELAAQGWLAAFVPEAAGGLGLGPEAAAALVGPLAAGFAVAPLDSHFLACRVLAHVGAAPEAYAGVEDGSSLPVLAFQERAGDVFAPASVATRLGADLRLTGAKRFVLGHQVAGRFLVTARAPRGGLVLVEVAAGAEGLEATTQWRADGGPMGALGFASLPARVVCDDPELVAGAVARAVDETALVLAAETVAHIEAMRSLLLEHLRTRVQFDRPIGAFQALQHRAVDLHVAALVSRAVLEPAVTRVGAGVGDASARALLVSRVRARASATARTMAREAIQMFGAIGMTAECDLGIHGTRGQALNAQLGTEAEHRRRLAGLLADDLTQRMTEEIAR